MIVHNRTLYGLIVVLLIYAGLSLANSVTIPLSKAPDEYVHFLYSRFLVENKRLPVTAAERESAGYKSDQPPLYYGLLALVTGRVDTDGGPVLKMTWDSPRRKLADIVLPRGMIVWTEDETAPYRGVVLAWFLGRWLSGVLSGLTIGLVYVTGLQIFPGRGHLALGAAAAVALTPAYLFISAVLNDDNLIGLIVALFFLLLVRIAQGNSTRWLFVGLGALLGLAMITKYSTLILPLELGVALARIGRRWGWSKGDWLGRLGICFGVAALVASWWFVFVGWHFNQIDELGWLMGVVKPIVAGDASDPTVARLTGLAEGTGADIQAAWEPFHIWLTTFFLRFWEVPVFGRPPLYPAFYTGLLMLGVSGASLYGLGRIWRRQESHSASNFTVGGHPYARPQRHSAKRASATKKLDLLRQDRFWLQLCALHLLAFIILPLVRYLVSGKVHDTAQARHLLFPTAPAFGLLLVWGLSTWFSERRWFWKYYLAGLVLLALSLAQLYYFTIAFPDRLPVRTVPELADRPAYPFSAVFEDGIELIGYDYRLRTGPAALEVVLYWQSLAYTHEDYLVEISLLNDQGQVAAQTVAHPAHGRYPMRAWDPGDAIRQTISLPLPQVQPGRYALQLRLLGWDEPLPTQAGSESLVLTDVSLPSTSEGPAPGLTLAGDTASIGFNLWQDGSVAEKMPTYRYLADIPVTLADLPAQADLRVWLVGPDDQRREPTTAADELQTFIVEYNWPSGVYRLEGELWQETALLERLVSASVLQVENRPTPFEILPMDHRLEANFDDKIVLLGYDLPARRVEAEEGVSIVLYWQALDRIRKSYVIFARLLDSDQQVWGGYDRLPQETYSTILWVPGEVVTDGFIIPIEAGAPDGIYHLVFGLYYEEGGEPVSLPLIQNGSPTDVTSVSIGPIKVGGPPPGATVQEFEPQVERNDLFGDPPLVRLRGYDLAVTEDQLSLTLYWQSEAQTAIDYTRFIHLRDEAGQNVAQSDGRPGGGVYLSSVWDPGEVIADEAVIPLPEDLGPSPYTLAVGLYDPKSGQRLPVPTAPTADGSLSLTAVELK